MNINQAKNLKQGATVYHKTQKNADGTRMRAKVLSVKTWKRDKSRVLVSVKHGLYDYAKFDEFNIHILSARRGKNDLI